MANAIIKVKRGLAANLPTSSLNIGEFLFATDTGDLYICDTTTSKIKLAKSDALLNYLLKSDNLAGLTDKAVARTNLSVYSKAETQQLLAGLRWKDTPGVVVSLTNVALTGLQTIDGYTTVAGDRVLLAGQTDAKTNGLYVAATGAWVRADDADSAAELFQMAIFVSKGTTYHDTAWLCTTDDIVIGTSNINYTQFAGANLYVEGFAIDINGNQIALDLEELTAGTSFDTGDMLVFIDTSATGTARMKLITKANFLSTIGVVSDTYKVKAFGTDTEGYLADKLAVDTTKKGLTISGATDKVMIGMDLSLVNTASTMDATTYNIILSSPTGVNEKAPINAVLAALGLVVDGGTY